MGDPNKRPRANSLPYLAFHGPSLLSINDGQQRDTVRVRISYLDDAICTNSVANLYRLLRVAKHESKATTNSTWMAKKALQYRKKLERARATDVEDPAFDVSEFMGITWTKTPEV